MFTAGVRQDSVQAPAQLSATGSSQLSAPAVIQPGLQSVHQLSILIPPVSVTSPVRSSPVESQKSTTSEQSDDSATEWPHKMVLLLISLYSANSDEMHHRNDYKNSKTTKKAVWKKIAEKMNEAGYTNVSWLSCDKKFRNLNITYRKVLDNNNKTGRGRKEWQYFKLMHELFERAPATMPQGVEVGAGSSSCGTVALPVNVHAAQQTRYASAAAGGPGQQATYGEPSTLHSSSLQVSGQSGTTGSVSTSASPKKKVSRKRKSETAKWFAEYMEESKKADAQKTEMLRQMHEDQKEQAAERLSVMKSLNDNMAKLIEKL